MFEPTVERCDVKGFPFLETSVILPTELHFIFFKMKKKSEFSCFFGEIGQKLSG